MSSARRAALAAGGAAAAAMLVFSPALTNGFVAWDDLEAVVYNERIRGLTLANLRWMLTSFEQSTWQPLPWLVYALIHSIQGAAPFGYHLFMLVLHGANAALVCGLGLALGASLPAAAAASALFALHPVQTESVVSAASISDMMAATFSLASLLAYARAPERARPAAAWLLFAAAGLCRWQAISVAAAAPLVDWVRGRRPRAERLWPFAAGAVALALVYARVKSADFEGTSRGVDAGAAAAGALVYLEKLLAPLAYLPFYNIAVPPRAEGAAFALVILALTAALAYLARRRREPLGAWLFFLLFVAPTLGLRRDDVVIARDRYAYLAFLGFYLAAGAGWAAAWRAARAPAARAALAGALVAALGGSAALSRGRALAWKDAETFWLSIIATEPRIYIARPHVAEARLRRGDYDGAVEVLAAQMAMFPTDRHGAYLLLAAFGRGVPAESLEHAGRLGIAARTTAEKSRVLDDVGFELARAGLYEAARAYYERALELHGPAPRPLHNLAYALAKLGEREKAAELLRRALELEPEQKQSRALLATLY